MVKTFLLGSVVLLSSGVLAAQPIGGGFKVGVPLTDAFKVRTDIPTLALFAPFAADSSNYTLGPYIELRLPFRLSIEADALYRRYDFTTAGVSSSTSSWEFPIVVKHKLLAGPLKPYFEGGLAFSRLSDIRTVSIDHLSNYGIVVGGGLEINALLLKISPEIRYTGWGFRNFDSLVQSQRNQVAFLVGFGF